MVTTLQRSIRNGASRLLRGWPSLRLPYNMPMIPIPQQHAQQRYMRLDEADGFPGERRLVEISKVLHALPGRPEQAAAAAQDEHEAKVVDYLLTTKGNDDVVDETLFRLLTACYAACLPDADRMSCCTTLPYLDCMVDFAQQELLSGKTPAFCHDLHSQDEEVSGYIEDLWASFCHHRNIQVRPEGPERNIIAMGIVTLPPYQKPADEFRWRCGENASDKDKLKTSTPLYKGGIAVVPKFFDLASMIAESDYFQCLPVDRRGWNLREFARAQQESCELLNRVDRAYSQLDAVRASDCPPNEWPDEYDSAPEFIRSHSRSAPLLVKDLKLLLEAMHNNKLLRSLTAQRPPLTVSTHHYALTTCTQHAHIWLAGYDLNIFYDHSLTYAQLCTQAVKEEDEQAVLRDVFNKERVSSIVEHRLRHNTLSDMRNDLGGEVMHLEDYDRLQAADRQPCWRGFITVLPPGDDEYKLGRGIIDCCVLIDLKRMRRRSSS